jgi:hypothetical protein
LEEYNPKIIYIKGILNTLADAISDYDPKLNKTNNYTHAMLGVEPEELSAQQLEIICVPLAKLQQEQHANASLLYSYE